MNVNLIGIDRQRLDEINRRFKSQNFDSAWAGKRYSFIVFHYFKMHEYTDPALVLWATKFYNTSDDRVAKKMIDEVVQ